VDGTLTGNVVFDGDGLVTLADGANLTGMVTTDADNQGTLTVEGSSTISGTVGTNTSLDLKQINGGGVAGKTAAFDSAVFANALNVTGPGIVQLNANSTIATSTVDTTGILAVSLASTLTGDVVFDGDGELSFSGFGGNLTGIVTTDTDGQGTLTAKGGNTTVTGQVGTNALKLKQITGGTDGALAVFNSAVFADALNITESGEIQLDSASTIGTSTIDTTGTLDVDGTLTGNVVFDGDGLVTLADGAGLTGIVTTATNNTGTLTSEGDSTITGQVGTNALKLKQVNGGASAGKTTTFNSAVFATTLNVTGAGEVQLDTASTIGTSTIDTTGTLDVNGDLTGTVNFAGDGTLEIADGVSIGGAVTNATPGDGTVTLEGDFTVNGTNLIGAAGDGLKAINVNGAAGKVVDFNDHTVVATTVTIGGTGTLNLNQNLTGTLSFGADGIVNVADSVGISGLTSSTAPGIGTLNLLGAFTTQANLGNPGANLLAINMAGITTMDHNFAATNTNVNTGGTLNLTAGRMITGNLNLNGTGAVNVFANTLTITGTYTQNAGTTLMLDIPTGTTNGSVASGGISTVDAGSTVAVNVTTPSATISNGNMYTVVDGTGAGAIGLPTVTDTDPIWGFKPSTNGSDLILTAFLAKTFSGVAVGDNNAAVARVLDDLLINGGGTPDMDDVLASLITLSAVGSNIDVNNALASLLPIYDGSIISASFSMFNQFLNVMSARLGNQGTRLRFLIEGEDGEVGIATGEGYVNHGIWARGFGSYLNQGERDGFDGYDARILGTAVGYDYALTEHLKLGTAFSFANSDINHDISTANNSNINSYQWGVYSNYERGPFFLDGLFAFSLNDYESSRSIVFPGVNRTADSDYYGQEYSFLFNTGWTFLIKDLGITPMASFRYSRLNIGDYTEEGAGALNLHIDDQGYDAAEIGAGVKVDHPFAVGKSAIVTPEMHFMYVYDAIGDKQQLSSTFTGGGGSFATSGFKPNQHTFNLGGGVTLFHKKGVTVSLNYNAQMKEDFYSHSGVANVQIEF